METKVRSGWNKLWIFLLVAFNVFMAVEAVSMTFRVADLRKSATGFTHLAISAIAGQRMTEIMMLWFGGSILLAIAVWLTRPTATVIETRGVAEAMALSSQSPTDRRGGIRWHSGRALRADDFVAEPGKPLLNGLSRVFLHARSARPSPDGNILFDNCSDLIDD